MRKKRTPPVFALLLSLTLLGINTRGQTSGRPYRLSDREVSRLLDRVKNKTEGYRQYLRKALDRTRLDGTSREDNINDFVKSFESEAKKLEDHFRQHKSTGRDVESMLQRALQIDAFMSRHPLDQVTQAAWETLRSDLEILASAYNVFWQWPVGWQPFLGAPYRVSDRQVEDILHQIERQADLFRKSLDSALDQSRLNGTQREDDINTFVKEFSEETRRLHDHFDSHESTAHDVQTVLDRAARIDQFMRRNQLTGATRKEWSQLRSHLDELASVYNVRWRWL